jgi:cysteine desulfuration protein SufE
MMTLDEIVDVFELLGDWEQRYQYLVELGEGLPDMPKEYYTDDNKVCMSQVWVQVYADAADPNQLHYHGDCDTSVIKGVLALLFQLTDGKSADEIQRLDVDEMFERLKLDEHLSPNRHVGVYAIVELMKQQARDLKARRSEVA